MSIPSSESFRQSAPVRVSGVYLAAGLSWVWLSDFALVGLELTDADGFRASVAKGSLFVIATAAFLFWLVRREMAAVRASARLLRAVVEGTTDAVFVKDPAGKYLLVNEATARFVGKSVADVLGRDDTELFDAAGAEKLMADDRAIMAGGEAVTLEETLTAAGVDRVYQATKAPFRGEDGALLGVIGVSRDVTELRRAQEWLRRQQAFTSGILDSVSAEIAVLDPAGVIVAVNGAWGAVPASDPGAAERPLRTGVGANYLAVCDAAAGRWCEDGARAAAGIRAVLTGAADQYTLEYPCHTPTRARWSLMTVTRFVHEVGAVVAHTDITERKRAEEELRASEARFRDLADAIPQIVWTAEPDGAVSHLNAKAVDYAGVTLDAMTGWSWDQLIHPDDLAGMVAAWTEAVRTGVPRDIESRIRRADGVYRWHITRQVPSRNADGTIATWYGTCTDIDDLKTAERASRTSEARFRQVFENAAIGIAVTDAGGRFLQVNPAYQALLGYSEEELLRTDSPVLVHPDDAAANREWLRRLLAGEAPSFEVENRYVDKSGSVVWVRKFASTLPGDADAPPHLLILVSDVTARRETERAIRESEVRFRTMFENTPTGIAITDAAGQFLQVNPAYQAILGYDEAELRRLHVSALVHPDDLAANARQIGRLLAGDVPFFEIENRYRHKSGAAVWVRKYVSLLPDAAGTGAHVMALVTDVTERRRAEKMLRDQELLLHEAAELAHVGGWGFDPVTFEPDWTPEVARIYELPTDQPPAVAVALDFFDADGRPRLEQALEAAIRDGTPHDLELRFVSATGTRKWVRTICRPVLAAGKVVRVRGSLQDITARKSLEEQYHQAQKMEAVGRLAGGVAHDFNNLLTVINGYADLLLIGRPGDGDRRAVAQIREAGERAAALTAQLLAFSRRAVIAPRVVDVGELVGRSEQLLQRLIGEDVRLTVAAAACPCFAEVDPNQFDQIVMNLCVNARDAMPGGGRLTIGTGVADHPHGVRTPLGDLPPGRYVEVVVADTGSGMSADVQARIFEPFFTTKEVGRGTGLGLAVTQGIVQQAGGGIQVESAVGEGTRFRLLFPEAVAAPLAAAVAAAPGRTAGTETVLLVEDDESVRMVGRIALESHGYRVLEAECGADAIRLADTAGEIHLLVTDVVMPEMNGRELAEALRGQHPALRVLFVSGYTDDSVFLSGVRDATAAFLQKPFSPFGLAQKVRDVLDGGP